MSIFAHQNPKVLNTRKLLFVVGLLGIGLQTVVSLTICPLNIEVIVLLFAIMLAGLTPIEKLPLLLIASTLVAVYVAITVYMLASASICVDGYSELLALALLVIVSGQIQSSQRSLLDRIKSLFS